jgi:hypothetical protein
MMKQPRLRAWRLARASRRGERQTPPAPGLPAIAAKADDLEEIKKSVEDAASVSGGLWLSYLFVLSYIAIAAGAVTHEDLCWCAPSNCPSSMSNCL